MQAIYAQIKAAEDTLKALKAQLVTAETLKVESMDNPELSSRHSLDRSRVEMLDAAIVRAELQCKREELLLALYEADKEAEETAQEYFRAQSTYAERNA